MKGFGTPTCYRTIYGYELIQAARPTRHVLRKIQFAQNQKAATFDFRIQPCSYVISVQEIFRRSLSLTSVGLLDFVILLESSCRCLEISGH